jgi:hypothetical protein
MASSVTNFVKFAHGCLRTPLDPGSKVPMPLYERKQRKDDEDEAGDDGNDSETDEEGEEAEEPPFTRKLSHNHQGCESPKSVLILSRAVFHAEHFRRLISSSIAIFSMHSKIIRASEM